MKPEVEWRLCVVLDMHARSLTVRALNDEASLWLEELGGQAIVNGALATIGQVKIAPDPLPCFKPAPPEYWTPSRIAAHLANLLTVPAARAGAKLSVSHESI